MKSYSIREAGNGYIVADTQDDTETVFTDSYLATSWIKEQLDGYVPMKPAPKYDLDDDIPF